MHLLTWIIVGMVWSMTFQVSDIKVVFDRLFRHLWREREKTKKMKKLLNRKTLQINLKRNDNQSGSIFMNMQCIVGSPEGKIYSRIFRIYHISLLKLLYFTDIKRRCWITERQTRKKSAQYKVKSRRHSENLLKKSYQFLTYSRAYLRKGRYAPAIPPR